MLSTSLSLLERLRAGGDADAWERFVRMYVPVLSLWARRAGFSATDIPDFVQDVLVLLCGKIHTFEWRREGRFRDWLHVVAMNRWREHFRKRHLTPVDVGPEELVEPETARQFWEQEYNAALAARALDLARNEFEETTWKAFWMTTVEERDADTVGRELGLSRGAVYTAKSRVLNRLRKELGGLWE